MNRTRGWRENESRLVITKQQPDGRLVGSPVGWPVGSPVGWPINIYQIYNKIHKSISNLLYHINQSVRQRYSQSKYLHADILRINPQQKNKCRAMKTIQYDTSNTINAQTTCRLTRRLARRLARWLACRLTRRLTFKYQLRSSNT